MSVLVKQLSVNFPFVFPARGLHPSRRALGPGAWRGGRLWSRAQAVGGFKVVEARVRGAAQGFSLWGSRQHFVEFCFTQM